MKQLPDWATKVTNETAAGRTLAVEVLPQKVFPEYLETVMAGREMSSATQLDYEIARRMFTADLFDLALAEDPQCSIYVKIPKVAGYRLGDYPKAGNDDDLERHSRLMWRRFAKRREPFVNPATYVKAWCDRSKTLPADKPSKLPKHPALRAACEAFAAMG